jgi:hypothetical protein
MKELLIACCIVSTIICIQAFRYWMYYKICSRHSLALCRELYKEIIKIKTANSKNIDDDK